MAGILIFLALYFPLMLFLRFALPEWMPGRDRRVMEAAVHTLILLTVGGLVCFLCSRPWWNRKGFGDRAAMAWLAFLTAASRLPLFFLFHIQLNSDYRMYFELAQEYAETGVYPATDYLVVVGPYLVHYVVFLGWVFRIFGANLLSAQLANTALNMVSCCFLYRLGRRFLPGRAAFGCTLAFLLSPTGLLFSQVPATEHLALPAYLAGLDLATAAFFPSRNENGESGRWVRAAAAGVLLSFSNTIRANALIALLGLTICQLARLVRAPRAERTGRLKPLVFLLVGFFVYQGVYGLFQAEMLAGKPVQSTLGWTLYEGLDKETAGKWRQENLDVLLNAMETLPLEEVQPYLLRKTLERVSTYSAGDWLSLFPRKGVHIWIFNDYGYSLLNSMDAAFVSDQAALALAVRRLCNFCYLSGLMSLSLAMVRAARRRLWHGRRGFGVVLLALQVFLMVLWHSFGTSIPRYHYYLLPLMPLMICLCFQDAQHTGDGLRKGKLAAIFHAKKEVEGVDLRRVS